MSQLRKLSHHGSHKPPLQKQQHIWQHVPTSAFDTSFYYLPSVIEDLSAHLGHTVGHFDSVQRSVRHVYCLLILALCRHDPLPRMVRSAVETLALASLAPPPPLSPVSTHAPLIEQHQRSEIETITALDIPYTLRHFDFDLAAVNNGDGSVVLPAATISAVPANASSGTGGVISAGSFSFSLSDLKSVRHLVLDATLLSRVCRFLAKFLVATEFSLVVRHAVKARESGSVNVRSRRSNGNASSSRNVSHKASNSGSSSDTGSRRASDDNVSCSGKISDIASGKGSCSHTGRSRNPTERCTPLNSAFNTTSENSSSPSSPMSSASPPPTLLTPTASPACGGQTTLSLSGGPLLLSFALDGSNSNRATSQMSQLLPPQQVQHQSHVTVTTEDRLCPQHQDRSRAQQQEGEFSCAVCAAQHFMHRHMQRLAQERGGLARLEVALGDCLQLQEEWHRSVSWVAGSVRDKRLPESIRPLVRCICAEAACDTGGVRGVTVNPQIIISTDGHCNAVRCGSGTYGIGGRGCGSGNCCWEPSTAPATKDAP